MYALHILAAFKVNCWRVYTKGEAKEQKPKANVKIWFSFLLISSRVVIIFQRVLLINFFPSFGKCIQNTNDVEEMAREMYLFQLSMENWGKIKRLFLLSMFYIFLWSTKKWLLNVSKVSYRGWQHKELSNLQFTIFFIFNRKLIFLFNYVHLFLFLV